MIITNEGFAVIERDTHIGKWVQLHKRLDFDIQQIENYLPYFKDHGTFVNVGANIGCYALPFIDKAKLVICFEPHPESFACLAFNLSKYHNVVLINEALSDDNRKYSMCFDDNNIGASYINHNAESMQTTKYLDQYRLSSLDFILMDCEGSELNILRGAINTIIKYQPIIVMEINEGALNRHHAKSKNVFDFLDALGYTYRNTWKDQEMTGPQFDIICFPRGHSNE